MRNRWLVGLVAILVCLAFVAVALKIDSYYPINVVGRLHMMGASVTKDDTKSNRPIVGVVFNEQPDVFAPRFQYYHMFLLKALKGSLQTLDFRGRCISDMCVKELHDFKCLTTLVLSNQIVLDEETVWSPDGSYAIAISNSGLRALGQIENLSSLDLSATTIKDSGVRQLKACKKLTTLSLADTQITDAALQDLKELKHLKILNITNTEVTESGVKNLQNAMPSLQVVM